MKNNNTNSNDNENNNEYNSNDGTNNTTDALAMENRELSEFFFKYERGIKELKENLEEVVTESENEAKVLAQRAVDIMDEAKQRYVDCANENARGSVYLREIKQKAIDAFSLISELDDCAEEEWINSVW